MDIWFRIYQTLLGKKKQTCKISINSFKVVRPVLASIHAITVESESKQTTLASPPFVYPDVRCPLCPQSFISFYKRSSFLSDNVRPNISNSLIFHILDHP